MVKIKRAYVEIVRGCNLKCRMCTGVSGHTRKQMQFHEIEHIVTQLKMNNIESVDCHGMGEPTIHKDFANISRLLRKNFNDTILITNGLLLCGELAKEIAKIGYNTIRFSMTGLDPLVYERYQGYGSDSVRLLGEVTKNITDFIELRNKYSPDTQIVLNYLLSPENKEDCKNYIRAWEQKADDFYIAKEIPYEKNEYVTDYPCEILMSEDNIIITMDCFGNVFPCCVIPHDNEEEIRGFAVGNIFEQSLEEILKSERLKNMIAYNQKGEIYKLASFCQKCAARNRPLNLHMNLKAYSVMRDCKEYLTRLGDREFILYGYNGVAMAILNACHYHGLEKLRPLVVDKNRAGEKIVISHFTEEYAGTIHNVAVPDAVILKNRKIIVCADKAFFEIADFLDEIKADYVWYKDII